jgi:ACS family hexuronate transporter-like MFS transporter
MTRYRWFIVAVGFFAIIINYLDRTALSYAITPLEESFQLTNTDFGIIAAGFGVGYLIMTVVGGILVDNYGARKIWSASSIAWSFACIMLGFATGFWWLFIFRCLLGIAEGPNFPALSRVNADWLPTSERARALAIGLAAVPFASVLGAPLVSHLLAWLGWRGMFIFLGAFGVIWAFIWVKVFHDKPKESPHVSASELDYIQNEIAITAHPHSLVQQKITWRFILFNRALLINNYAFFAFGYLVFFAITWLPGYLEQTYGLKVKEAGWFLIAPWSLATILLILGGILSDWIWKKTHSIRLSRSYIIWICQILSAICFIPIMFHPSLVVAITCISLGIGFGMMPNAAFYAINTDLARERVATSLGVMDCAFAFAGIVAPLLTGWLSSVTGNFAAAFSLLIVLTFSSAIAIILFQHPE